MNPDVTDSFWWRAYEGEQPEGAGCRPIGEANYREKEVRITGHHFLYGPAPAWADDLLRAARAAFLADKLVRRDASFDRWTRRIRLSVPVSERERWEGPAGAAALLAALLSTLTGDVWDVLPRELPKLPGQEPLPSAQDWRAEEVALFSGGLDSLSWAATRAADRGAGPLLLVGFREIKAQDVQRRVHDAVRRLAEGSGRRIQWLTPSQHPKGGSHERSSRPRGLLYAATAVRAAAASQLPTVQIPENGQVALNPPLTAARASALSTRSVHPWSLYLLNELTARLGGSVVVENPWAALTKGEVCSRARDAGLAPAALADTLSCGYPPRRARGGRPFTNCGTCFPCLIRRAGLLHALGSDPTCYERDPWEQGLSRKRSENWRALRLWLARPYGARDLIGDQPLPPGADIRQWLRVVRSGREELRRLVSLG